VALPSSRNTTYTPGSPVRSNDLNDIQDAIIALNAQLAGQPQTLTKNIIPSPNGSTFTNTYFDMSASTSQNCTIQLDSHFLIGDIITAIRIAVTDSAIGPTTARATLRRYTTGTTSPSPVVSSNTSNGSGLLQTLLLGGLDLKIQSGFTNHVQVLFAGGNTFTRIWAAEVDYTPISAVH